MDIKDIIAQAKSIKASAAEAAQKMDLDDFSEGEPAELAAGKMPLPEYVASLKEVWQDTEGSRYWLNREYSITVTELNSMITAVNGWLPRAGQPAPTEVGVMNFKHGDFIKNCISFELNALNAGGRFTPEHDALADFARQLLESDYSGPTMGDPLMTAIEGLGASEDQARSITFGLGRLERCDPYGARVYFFNDCADMFSEIIEANTDELEPTQTDDGFR